MSKGAAAEVVTAMVAGFLLVESVGEGGGGRLVDDAKHFEPAILPALLGRLTLGGVEISGPR